VPYDQKLSSSTTFLPLLPGDESSDTREETTGSSPPSPRPMRNLTNSSGTGDVKKPIAAARTL